MRVLITAYIPSHFLQIVPLGWALRAAGHQVVVAGLADVAGAAVTAGLPAVRIGTDGGFSAHVRPGHMSKDAAPAEILTARELADRRPWADMSHWWRLLVQDTNHLYTDFARRWKPDLVVSEMDYNGLITAGLVGVPAVFHRWGPDLLAPMIHRHATDALREFCVKAGLPDGFPGPDLTLDPCPPDLQFDGLPAATPVRYAPYNGVGEMPEWARAPRRRPRVVVSLGMLGAQTMRDEWSESLVACIARAVSGLDGAEVILPLGTANADRLGTLPPSFRLVDPAPLNLFVDDCDLVIHHGGAGTCLTAAHFAVPQLVLAQQHPAYVGCGERVAATGSGLALDHHTVTDDPAAVGAAIDALLGDARYRRGAAQVARDMARLPPVNDMVGRLEELAGR
ncbi:glycosyl transferase [Streptomyces humidus]|uniref:Glycosyl transferase n=1 Tax=Streptomyces humidus TaxID=52259 RepID=A0A918G069_9ACTN|nr:nucleotide disphospho-sugar-binding domain-containing protein [Streptomyces humidus]GGS05450.1 glycosyl transferase [Streptomyces humidus]